MIHPGPLFSRRRRHPAWLLLAAAVTAGALASNATGQPRGAEDGPFSLEVVTLRIPQVDYEPALYYRDGDPYPHLDLQQVDRQRTVRKDYAAVVLENRYVRITLLPAMGRVYSFVYKPTAHETLWHNDIATVGGAANDTGWWLWIGGIEYTLPGDEHGTTWALPWEWRVAEDSARRKSVRMQVREPGTGLEETVEISLLPDRAFFETTIRVANPTEDTVDYAHWVNPQWAPGGRNELTDRTEFIIPTERISIEDRWQANLGVSPQDWATSPLRFIDGWSAMGDLMADGLADGFYSAYSHDAEEGIVRVFDPEVTPGVDVWTYGHRPTGIPMGSGAPNAGYVEMWGGTSRTYPDERRPLGPGESVGWTEWMYPYQGTGGLTFANRDFAVTLRVSADTGRATVALCPSGAWRGTVELWRGEAQLRRWDLEIDPTTPFAESIDLDVADAVDPADLRLRVGSDRDGWIDVAGEVDPQG
ncbi:MAG: DUF5107 domain-containing protein [Dehalococcoidia bacterium]|jgi:hypothetical protein|nr:DUF5107 domain-containing protein [Dehalococcoidia bacterium]